MTDRHEYRAELCDAAGVWFPLAPTPRDGWRGSRAEANYDLAFWRDCPGYVAARIRIRRITAPETIHEETR